MDRSERFYKIQALLQPGRPVPRQRFLDALEVSAATFKRDLEYLRDRFDAPIVWDREARGYRFDRSDPNAANWQLPGLWFSEEELRALLTVEHLLESIQPGLFGPQIGPLREKIRQLLGRGDHSAEEVIHRIRVLPMASRKLDAGRFRAVAAGLLSRRRLRLDHFRRQSGETLERVVSPQRLVHYRDNWYLDAWCHLRDGAAGVLGRRDRRRHRHRREGEDRQRRPARPGTGRRLRHLRRQRHRNCRAQVPAGSLTLGITGDLASGAEGEAGGGWVVGT